MLPTRPVPPIKLKRLTVLLAALVVLSGCVGRQTLTGEPFRLTAPALEQALADVETRAALVDETLRIGFRSGNEQLWFPLKHRDSTTREGVTIHLAELDTLSRLYRSPPEDSHIRVIGRDRFAEMLRDMLRWLTPLEPFQGLMLRMHHRELVSWRDSQGNHQVAPLHQMPDTVRVAERIDDRQLAARMLELLELYFRQGEGEIPEHLLFTLDHDQPGSLAWIHADMGTGELHYIASPFAGQTITEPRLRVSMKTLDRVVFRSHFLTVLRNPVTTLRRLIGQGEDALVSLLRRGPREVNPDAPLHEGPGMDLEAWEQRLDRITRSRNYPGRLELLVGGEEFFPDLIEHIHGARKGVDIRTYIFDRDEYAVRIADLLRERSEQVRVRVMMDDLGSLMAGLTPPPGGHPRDFRPPADIARYLSRGSQVEVRRVGNPWLTGDHVKLTIVDEETAWVGGMNYGAEYRWHWLDMMARVEGPIVRRLQQEFHKAWAHAGPAGDLGYLVQSLRIPRLTREQRRGEEDMVPLRPLVTRSGQREILRAQLEAINRSRSYIHIVTPYFTEPDIINALVSARARGVDVHVILPGEGNHNIMNSANLFTANRLIEAGVRVHAYPGMSHVKAAVYDGWASFGSANFDRLSFKVNQELNLATSHPAAVEALQMRLFDPLFEQATELTEPMPWNWEDTFARILSRPF